MSSTPNTTRAACCASSAASAAAAAAATRPELLLRRSIATPPLGAPSASDVFDFAVSRPPCVQYVQFQFHAAYICSSPSSPSFHLWSSFFDRAKISQTEKKNYINAKCATTFVLLCCSNRSHIVWNLKCLHHSAPMLRRRLLPLWSLLFGNLLLLQLLLHRCVQKIV
jgi:hypothetical protein